MKLCVDLCCGIGGFSAAFRDSEGWEVIGVDNNPELNPDRVEDVMDLQPSDLPEADVYLGSPPCPMFSFAGNHDKWDDRRPIHDDARDAIALARHVYTLCEALSTGYWFVENPRGRLRWFLGRPTGTVTYCQYGKPYQKPTDLWGEHPPITYRRCSAGDGCHSPNGSDDGTSAVASMPSDHAERSAVPYELSKAILQAVEGETRSEQTTFGELQ